MTLARLLAGALLLAVTGCGTAARPAAGSSTTTTAAATTTTTTTIPDRPPHTLVFNATGGGEINSVRYSLDAEVVEEGPAPLPWRRSVIVPSDGLPHSWNVEISYTGTGDTRLDVFVLYDGVEVGRTAGRTSGTPGTRSEGGAGVGGSVTG